MQPIARQSGSQLLMLAKVPITALMLSVLLIIARNLDSVFVGLSLEIAVGLVVALSGWMLIRTWVVTASAPDVASLELRLFNLALIVRVAIALCIYVLNQIEWGNPMFNYFDSGFYHLVARGIAQAWRSHAPYYVPQKDPGYYYFVAANYFLFGEHPFVAIIANCVIGAATVVVGMRLIRLIHGKQAMAVVGYLIALYPPLWFYSSMLLKDCLVIFLWSIFAYALLRWSSWHSIVSLALSFYAMFWLRRFSFLVILLGIPIAYLLLPGRRGHYGNAQRLALLVGLLVLGTMLAIVYPMLTSTDVLANIDFLRLHLYTRSEVTGAVGFTEAVASGGVGLAKIFSPASPWAVVYIVPVAVGMSILSPFPPFPAAGNPLGAFASIADTSWHLLLPFSVYGMWIALRKPSRPLVFVVVSVTMVIVQSAVVFYGLQPRYRDQIAVFLLGFAAIGILNRRRMGDWLRIFMVGYWGMLIVYFIIKSDNAVRIGAGVAFLVVIALATASVHLRSNWHGESLPWGTFRPPQARTADTSTDAPNS